MRFAVLRSITAATPVQPLAISSLLASSALPPSHPISLGANGEHERFGLMVDFEA